jgi:hypothetical protein
VFEIEQVDNIVPVIILENTQTPLSEQRLEHILIRSMHVCDMTLQVSQIPQLESTKQEADELKLIT